MSREIKFRAWDPKLNFMCVSLSLYELIKRGDVNRLSELIPMQFTGLKDKNGKEIYEGDILAYSDEIYSAFAASRKWEVYWSNGNANFSQKTKHLSSFEFMPFDYTYANTCEVVGNIYEDPQLISEVVTK